MGLEGAFSRDLAWVRRVQAGHCQHVARVWRLLLPLLRPLPGAMSVVVVTIRRLMRQHTGSVDRQTQGRLQAQGTEHQWSPGLGPTRSTYGSPDLTLVGSSVTAAAAAAAAILIAMMCAMNPSAIPERSKPTIVTSRMPVIVTMMATLE